MASAFIPPVSPAREYAAVGCNFYRGCPFQCSYCYNRKGLTAKVNGLPYTYLKEAFSKTSRCSKIYQDMKATDYALAVFKKEVAKWYEHLLKHGIFFSFSTDPLSDETAELTTKAALYAAKLGIDVKIYWKDSIRKAAASPFNDEYVFGNKAFSVDRDWSLFKGE